MANHRNELSATHSHCCFGPGGNQRATRMPTIPHPPDSIFRATCPPELRAGVCAIAQDSPFLSHLTLSKAPEQRGGEGPVNPCMVRTGFDGFGQSDVSPALREFCVDMHAKQRRHGQSPHFELQVRSFWVAGTLEKGAPPASNSCWATPQNFGHP